MVRRILDAALVITLTLFFESILGTSLWAVGSKAAETGEVWLNAVAAWLFLVMIIVMFLGVFKSVSEYYKKTPD